MVSEPIVSVETRVQHCAHELKLFQLTLKLVWSPSFSMPESHCLQLIWWCVRVSINIGDHNTLEMHTSIA